MFDLSITKLLVLAVIALVIFGPDQLPKIAAQAGRALRELRRLAEGAKADLREGLGPEFADFDFADLNPRNFVRKHLLDDFDDNDRAEPPDVPPTPARRVGGGASRRGRARRTTPRPPEGPGHRPSYTGDRPSWRPASPRPRLASLSAISVSCWAAADPGR